MGVARKSMMISDKEKRVTAYHEAGHTLVGLNLPQTDPIHKVSIMPRGQALGVTQTLPDEDSYNLSSEKAHNYIAFLLGGRAAEEIVFNEKTNGASNDIERATALARNMVCHWGMSESMGPINYGTGREQPFAGMGAEAAREFSESTADKIDREVSRIIQRNHEIAQKILNENKPALIRISEALIVWETLDRAQILLLLEGKDIGVPDLKKDDGSQEEFFDTIKRCVEGSHEYSFAASKSHISRFEFARTL
jgi:cell division protease FtsH